MVRDQNFAPAKNELPDSFCRSLLLQTALEVREMVWEIPFRYEKPSSGSALYSRKKN